MYNVVESIKEDEGLRLFPYKDTNNILTIGYGHNLSTGITQEQADMLLKYDIENAKKGIANFLAWIVEIVPMEKYDALVELTFWIGIGGVMQFKNMLKALKNQDWQEASAQLMDSDLGRNFEKRAQKLANVIGA